MDEEDEYGIPHHYSQGSFQKYTNIPSSSFDDLLEDTLGDSQRDGLGECMRPNLVLILS